MSEICISAICNPDEMTIMLEEKREQRPVRILPVVFKRGFVNTKAGLNLRSPDILEATKAKEDGDKRKVEEKYIKMWSNEAKCIAESRRRRSERRALEHNAALMRSSFYKEPYKFPRALKVRRRIAAERTLLTKAVRIGYDNLTEEEQRRHPMKNYLLISGSLKPTERYDNVFVSNK